MLKICWIDFFYKFELDMYKIFTYIDLFFLLKKNHHLLINKQYNYQEAELLIWASPGLITCVWVSPFYKFTNWEFWLKP